MLKIILEKWEKAVVMQVLEQSKDISNELHLNSFFVKDLGIALKSEGSPDLMNDGVYIRGDNNLSDFDVVSITFGSNVERDKYYNKVVVLFNAFNNRKKTEKTSENNIFVME